MATYSLTYGVDTDIDVLKFPIRDGNDKVVGYQGYLRLKTSVNIPDTADFTIKLTNPSGMPSVDVPLYVVGSVLWTTLALTSVDIYLGRSSATYYDTDLTNLSNLSDGIYYTTDSFITYETSTYDDAVSYTVTPYVVSNGNYSQLTQSTTSVRQPVITNSNYKNRIQMYLAPSSIFVTDTDDNLIGFVSNLTASTSALQSSESATLTPAEYAYCSSSTYPISNAQDAYVYSVTYNIFDVNLSAIRQNSTLGSVQGLKTLYTVSHTSSENPYDDSSSSTGGGSGSGTPSDDDTQSDDGVPSLSITDTGLISLYAPTLSQLQAFGNYLWSDAFSVDTFKKLFSDPMDAILGMSIVPLNLSGVSSSLVIGNIDTGLTAPKLSRQYYTIDCGSFTVQPDVNSYLDYSPYTRFSVFLPYIGFQTLDADDIMNQTLNIKYKVDVLTTALICEIRINNHLRYSFSGTCGTSIPITAQNWGSMIQSVVSSATALAGLAVGAAAAPVTGGASLGLSAVGAAGSIAGNSLSMKPDIQKGGSLGGSPGFMGWQSPFLIRYTPRRVNSKSQQTYTGYPSLITSKLSDVHGYTEIQSINLSVSGATDSECVEIDRQLKQGVILP